MRESAVRRALLFMNNVSVRPSLRFPISRFVAMRSRRWMLFVLATLAIVSVVRAIDSDHEVLPNFDKRSEVHAAKARVAPDAKAVARIRAQVKYVQCEMDAITGSPAFIMARRGFLSGADGKGRAIPAAAIAKVPAGDRHRTVKAFINEHQALFGHGAEALDGALLERDYVTEHNGMREVVWQQQLDGIPVFEGKLQAHLTARGELINMASKFLPKPGDAAGELSVRKAKQTAPAVSAPQAVSLAAANLGEALASDDVKPAAGARGEPGYETYHAPRYSSISTRQVWLPMDRSTMRLCWEVLIDSKTIDGLYRVLIDAESGEAHLRQTLTEHISPVTYRVFTGESPTPFSPGHATPSSAQPPSVQRSLVTISALNTIASPNGWIDDGGNETIGNNVDAYTALDTDPLNGPDLPRTHGSPHRVFDFPLDLTQAPISYKEAAVTQAFYWCNFMHDKLYEVGFTEGADNFQEENFGRGGRSGDPAFVFVQDGSGFNNAGARVTGGGVSIHMYLWNGSDPDRDGALDVGILLHEYAHGLSNRLVGGGVGIGRLQTRGMGEGWSDFYALALLSKADDDLDANYPVGAYATYRLSKFTDNYYSGIRRYPYSTKLTANPLTYKDIDPTQADLHIGVPRSPIVGYVADEVHALGEVWCAALWEARANLIAKHGFATGNQLVLQLVTDGMKLSPANPTFLQARDAILMADLVKTGGANETQLWAAFAKRGMGVHATSPASSTAIGVVESFDVPDEISLLPATGFTSLGRVGGPFDVTSAAFRLTNTDSAPLAWSATAKAPWLKLSAAAGSLPAGGSITVTVSLETAGILPRGVYSGKVIFTNGRSGKSQTRDVSLAIGAPDSFAEVFDTSVNDTANQSFTFTPNGSANFCKRCCRGPK